MIIAEKMVIEDKTFFSVLKSVFTRIFAEV